MHLILVADIHLADSPKESFGVDTISNFERVLAQVEKTQPDHVVMMGDYSLKTPKKQDVQLAFDRLEALGIPYSFIAGNHDRSVDLAEVVAGGKGLTDGEFYYKRAFGDRLALFLDTAKGVMSKTQLSWVRQELEQNKQEALIFMHHPPIAMGVAFMDENHAFQDPNRDVFDVLFSGLNPLNVFAGHYHTARSTEVGMHSVHLCPSTYFQLVPAERAFAVSHTMPGLRHVELLDDQIRTWIEFLAPRKG